MKENSKLPETRSKIYEDNPGLGSEQIFKAQIEGFKQPHQQPVEHDKPKVSDILFQDLFWKLSRTKLKLHIFSKQALWNSNHQRRDSWVESSYYHRWKQKTARWSSCQVWLYLNLSYHEKLSKVTEYVANLKIVYYFSFH